MFTAANDSEACFDTIAGRLNNLTIRRELRVTGLLSYRASRSGKANAHCPSNAHRVRRWQALAIRLRLELPKLVAAWRLAQTADHPVDRPGSTIRRGAWVLDGFAGKDTYSTGTFSAPLIFQRYFFSFIDDEQIQRRTLGFQLQAELLHRSE